jgi:DNA-binding beta-propeller fold protein YncE
MKKFIISLFVIVGFLSYGHCEDKGFKVWIPDPVSHPSMNDAKEIAVAADGSFYIVLRNNLLRVDTEGKVLQRWGGKGNGIGEFEDPYALAIASNGKIYVADSNNHRIQVFNEDGTPYIQWGSYGKPDNSDQAEGKFCSPQGIALDSHDNAYVSDTCNQRMQKFDTNGNFLRQWSRFDYPVGMDVNRNDEVYVVDNSTHQIKQFDSSFGFIGKWGSHGDGEGEFYFPKGAAVDRQGKLYVADTGNHRIQKFNNTGGYIATYGKYGAGEGEFVEPIGIYIDRFDTVYVADKGNARIQRLGDGSGAFSFLSTVTRPI